MKIWGASHLWMTSSWVLAPPTADNTAALVQQIPAAPLMTAAAAADAASTTASSALQQGVSSWLSVAAVASASDTAAAAAAPPPSKADVQLLRQAFAEFYGVNRDLTRSEQLLSQVVTLWEKQPADERAALYRVRGDCYTLLADATKAAADYETAITLLQSSPAAREAADPSELPAALLGRARALKSSLSSSSSSSSSPSQQAAAKQAASDYEQYLKLTSREDWDTDQELLEDGATRNPFACWEWASVLRQTGDWTKAGQAHLLASQAFSEIGDKARSVISLTDAGIDYAAANNAAEATRILNKAIAQTPGVESRDVALLQRVISKEGEGRMALAALLWNGDSNEADGKAKAEKILGDACVRLEQMQAQQAGKSKTVPSTTITTTAETMTSATGLSFSIDDTLLPAMDMSCYRFRNPAFLDQLGWPSDLQKKVIKLETLR